MSKRHFSVHDKASKLFFNIKNCAVNAIGEFTISPFESVAYLCVVAAAVTAAVTFIVSFILLFVKNVYGIQMKLLTTGHFEQSFSANAAHTYYNRVSLILVSIFLVISFISIVIAHIGSAGKAGKIVMIIFSSVLLLTVAAPVILIGIYGGIYNGAIQFNRNNVNAISPIINIVTNPKAGIIYAIVLLASLIGIFVTLWVSDLGDFVKPFFIILGVAYAGAPLLLLLLENLIPLIVAIVIGVIAVVIIGMSLSGDGKSGESEKESGGSSDNFQTTKSKSGKQPKIKEFDSGVKLERVKGGWLDMYNDIIRVSNGIGESTVCSAYEYDHKEVIIRQGGKTVTWL